MENQFQQKFKFDTARVYYRPKTVWKCSKHLISKFSENTPSTKLNTHESVLSCRYVKLDAKILKIRTFNTCQNVFLFIQKKKICTKSVYNTSTITIYDTSTVTLYNNSTITLYNTSTITLYNTSTIILHNTSTITLYTLQQ